MKGECCCDNNIVKQFKAFGPPPAALALNPADIQGHDKGIRNHDTLNSVLGLYIFPKMVMTLRSFPHLGDPSNVHRIYKIKTVREIKVAICVHSSSLKHKHCTYCLCLDNQNRFLFTEGLIIIIHQCYTTRQNRLDVRFKK